jgi:hypothetical protein
MGIKRGCNLSEICSLVSNIIEGQESQKHRNPYSINCDQHVGRSVLPTKPFNGITYECEPVWRFSWLFSYQMSLGGTAIASHILQLLISIPDNRRLFQEKRIYVILGIRFRCLVDVHDPVSTVETCDMTDVRHLPLEGGILRSEFVRKERKYAV